MTHNIPYYIEERIREIPLPNMNIVSGSTPVIAFGNAQISRVATLGLNPSKHEFLDNNGIELTGSKRRLETLNSLNLQERKNINEWQIKQILDACNNYFYKNPYYWFNKLEKILKYFEVSYYSNTACHLDLVQWATDPVWGKLSDQEIKKDLIKQDMNFLRKQLSNENIEILLLNGHSVIKEFQKHFECDFSQDTKLQEGNLSSKIYLGYLFDRIKVIGWTINLQSSFGVTNTFIETIAQTVAKL